MRYEAPLASRQKMCEDTLERYDQYIVWQVHHLRRYYPTVISLSAPGLDIDEIVQCVRIKFWQALEKRDIRYPSAYIKLIVRSEFITMARRQKPLVSLSDNEDGVYNEAATLVDQRMPDPANEVEQREEASACLKEAIQAVSALPPRQRLAMICALRDRVDDLAQLVEAFKAYSVDIETMRWPASKAEKQLLLASLAPARKTVARKWRGYHSCH